MANKEGCCTTLVNTECLMIKLKLLSMDCWVRPQDRADIFHMLVFVIDYDDINAVGFLDSLHPMGMNDTWCDFMLRRSRVDKTEVKYFRSHFLFDWFGVCSSWGSCIRHGILISCFVQSGPDAGEYIKAMKLEIHNFNSSVVKISY